MAVLIVSEYSVMLMRSSLCEKTGAFACILYRKTASFPADSQSGRAKLTASLKLIYRQSNEQGLLSEQLTPWLKPQWYALGKVMTNSFGR